MSIFNVIRLLLFLFAFIVTVLALPADPVVAAPAVAVPTPTSLAPLYVVKTGRLAVSGCSNEDIAELTSAYSEAIQMMAKAQNVLNGGQVPWADAKDRALWARQSLLLYELFRIVIDPDTGAVVPPSPDVDVELNDAAALGTVTDVFSRPVSQAQAAMTGTPDEEAINYVVCGDEGITYLSATDPHPEEPGVQLNADGKFPHGAYYLPGDTNGFPNVLMTAYPSEKTGEVLAVQDKFCDIFTDAQTAYTVSGSYLVIFCTEAFSDHPNTVDTTAVQAGKDLTNYLALSVIWAHELTHVWSATADWEAVTEDPKLLVEPYRDDTGTWVPSPKDSLDEVAYGAVNCMMLAINYPDEALSNADNFAMYALGIWLSEWLWIGGIAVKEV